MPKAIKAMHDQSHRAVVFSSKVEYIKIPATGEQRRVEHKPRVYDTSYPTSESVPKTDKLVLHRAQVIARQLHMRSSSSSTTISSPSAASNAVMRMGKRPVATVDP